MENLKYDYPQFMRLVQDMLFAQDSYETNPNEETQLAMSKLRGRVLIHLAKASHEGSIANRSEMPQR